VIKLRKMGRVGHVESIGEIYINICRVLVREPEHKRLLGKSFPEYENKKDLKK
jgi:hypothetical protein